MQHAWVASLGGTEERKLSAAVVKGAATTAAARRFRSLVHGIAGACARVNMHAYIDNDCNIDHL